MRQKNSCVKVDNVISLRDRIENWRSAYQSPTGDLKIMASNQGRLNIKIQMCDTHTSVQLNLIEAITLLSAVSDQIQMSMNDLYDN